MVDFGVIILFNKSWWDQLPAMQLHQINVDDTLSLVGCNMNLCLYEANLLTVGSL